MNGVGITLKRSNIMGMGIVGTLVLIILASGCISSPTTDTKTFSDGAMSFNYPDNFVDITEQGNSNSSSSSWQDMVKLGNNNLLNMQVILVAKNTGETLPAEIRDNGVLKVKKQPRGEVLSTTTETNTYGILVEKSTYKQEDSVFGRVVYNDMFFKINGVVYAISVYGPDSNKQQIMETANIVFQSIK